MKAEEIRGKLIESPKYIDLVDVIVEYEEENSPKDSPWTKRHDWCDTHWEYDDVGAHPSQLHQLITKRIVRKVSDTNSTTRYCLRDREATKEALEDLEGFKEGEMAVEMHSFPDNEEELDGIFDDVIGYDKVKWLMKRALTTDDITNVLLVGPPGSAKTVFLMCINELENSKFISGSPTSGPGVLDLMFEDTPKYMLIDEMDDMDAEVQQTLSQYTETGILDETKSGKTRKLKTNTKTFGSANSSDDIIDQIEDRFLDLHFEAYTKSEFIEVCQHMLPDKEDCTVEEAIKIAKEVWRIEGEGRVRKAIQVARLSRGDPEKVVDVLEEYDPGNSKTGVFQ